MFSTSCIKTGALLTVCVFGVQAASAASVTVLSQDRHAAARMIVHGQDTTQQFATDTGSEWKQVAQVVVDNRVRSRAVELSTIREDGNGATIFRSRNRVGIESTLDVATTSAVAASAPHDPFPAAAFGGIDPLGNASSLRLAGSAESWFDVSFRVDQAVSFTLFALGNDTTADLAGVEGLYRVTLSSLTDTLFDFTSDLVTGAQGPEWLSGLLAPGEYRYRVYAAISGESTKKVPVQVDSKLVLMDLPDSLPAAVPTPAAAGLGLALLLGAVGRRQRD